MHDANLATDEGASLIEEPPDTPAHIFAVRAFKTAIFGTPHPSPYSPVRDPQPSSKTDNSEANVCVVKSTTKAPKRKKSPDGAAELTKTGVEPMPSPTKGILLTPGMGTSRRKNVSFMQCDTEKHADAVDLTLGEIPPGQDDSPTRKTHRRDMRPRPSIFTKTLIELSKQRSAEHMKTRSTTLESTIPLSLQPGEVRADEAIQTEPDYTIDLSQPRSRSGQHWKAEYEQYYRRSEHEMKNIIQYSQNVKSYAVKKDSEASRLAEKLQKAYARMESMESKVSKLASRLNIAQAQDTTSDGDQARLISELAQQTAMVIKYKQRVNHFRKAIQQQSAGAGPDEGGKENQITPDVDDDDFNDELKQGKLEAQLERLKQSAKIAEDRATKLDTENAALKRSLARVKQEMMSYESRRQAREKRLKIREEKHKVAKQKAEAQLAQLRTDHQKLLDERGSLEPSAVQSRRSEHNMKEPPIMSDALLQKHPLKSENAPSSPSQKANKMPLPPISLRERRHQKPAMDIWTLNGPRDGEEEVQWQATEPTELPPSSVKQDINRALKEIDFNLVTEASPTAPKPALEKAKTAAPAPQDPPEKVNISPAEHISTSPGSQDPGIDHSPGNISSHGAKSQLSLSGPSLYFNPSDLTGSPSISTLSRAGGSRTSSMGSRRTTSAMTAERAKAAKVRLTSRNAEKKGRVRRLDRVLISEALSEREPRLVGGEGQEKRITAKD
ncbi:MAG: hypothetical protein Q9163_004422 [Psora crenata]